MQTISDEADRLAQLMSNLLDLSRHEAGLLPLKREPVQLAELVARVTAHLNPPTPAPVVDLPTDLPPVKVDALRTEVVLRNLLSNARAYGNGAIHLAARRRGDDVVVRVTDDGPGLEPEELSRIFERFYRAPGALQKRSDGTGLGLAISKAFVEAHGGTIWAESSAGGTTISFTLPCAGPLQSQGAETIRAATLHGGA